MKKINFVVYKLVNRKGEIEYIGHTRNPKTRLRNHICKNGKFAGRNDLTFEIIKSGFRKKSRAFQHECKIQKELGFESDKQKSKRLGKVVCKIGSEFRKVPVAAYKITGEFLGVFNSIKEAANNFDIYASLIQNVLKGKQKQTFGYTFKKV